jgi:predicted nucleic acid-binding protein
VDVLVDTCVWSLAFRRSRTPTSAVQAELAELIREGRVVMLGAIRQEILSGVKVAVQFDSLRTHFRAFPDVNCDTGDYEEAASCCNRCRSKGVQGAAVDFLICAVALRHRLAVFTTDADFKHYARILGVSLYQPRKSE